MRLEGKTALITGASRGIGRAVAEAFAREGARVAVGGSTMESAARAAEALHGACPKAEILPVGLDVTNTASVDSAVARVRDRWGVLDVLVNNAGITDTRPLLYTKDEDFIRLLEVDLTGAFRCIRAAAAAMEGRGGCIISTGSVVGLYGGRHQAAYAAAKAGLHGLTRACARELGPMGIRVNAVAPGVVLTDMVARSVTGQQLETLRRMTPLGRAATPAELTGAYVYLASEEARFTTGAVIQVDGGLVL